MEYYSTLKKKEILPLVTTWMDLEDIMLSEISELEKNKYCMICGVKKKTDLKCKIKLSQGTKKNVTYKRPLE